MPPLVMRAAMAEIPHLRTIRLEIQESWWALLGAGEQGMREVLVLVLAQRVVVLVLAVVLQIIPLGYSATILMIRNLGSLRLVVVSEPMVPRLQEAITKQQDQSMVAAVVEPLMWAVLDQQQPCRWLEAALCMAVAVVEGVQGFVTITVRLRVGEEVQVIMLLI
tara:strand:- start:9 stop:500 length:492 start_codon:yes stop_codon:yes gene_type:complete